MTVGELRDLLAEHPEHRHVKDVEGLPGDCAKDCCRWVADEAWVVTR